MHIILTVPAIGGIYGGPSKSILALAKSLGRQGVMVDLVTTNANGNDKLDVPLQNWIAEENYRVQYFPCQVYGDYKWSTPLAKWLWRNLHSYDGVYINAIFSLTSLPFYWTCRCQKIPYVIAPRGMLEPWALANKAWKKYLYYRLLERPSLNRAIAIHALASTEAKNILSLGLNSPIVTIPNGIFPCEFERLPSPEIFYQKFSHIRDKILILFLGRIDPKKGLDLLAPAFAQVNAQFPNTHLVVAGPDNIGFLPVAQQYFKDENCLHSVTFTGMLTGKLKLSALSAAGLYVSPSYSEGFSMSVLEGMACGLPCVITNGCNFPEADTAQAAHVVDIKSEAIALALINLLKGPDAAKAMGNRAHQFVLKNYTWDTVATNLVQVYQAILNGKPVPHQHA